MNEAPSDSFSVTPSADSGTADSGTTDPAHPVADGVKRRLDPSWITARRISGLFVSLILITAFGGAAIGLGIGFGLWILTVSVWAVLSVLILARAWFWPPLAWKYAAYAVSSRGLRVRRGVLVRSIASVPKSRVQHTDVSQGPLQRHFGIATLTVHTAGTQYAAVPVPGLPHQTALAIRNFLIDDEDDEDDGV